MIDTIRTELLILTSVLFAANLVQSFFYLREANRREGAGHMSNKLYFLCFFAFYVAMLFTILAKSLPMMWVAIELTTLVSAPLIAYHRSRGALEAMWKYLLVCSIGIALALLGTMIVLHAEKTGDVQWYKTGFAFILAGYGAKTGLAPFHTWLPDAHSEAPAPVSALLSGALLNCSFFAIMRFRNIMPQEAAAFCDSALVTLGMASLAIAAIFMVRQSDYKRLLAYSSIEHMGIAAMILGVMGMKDDLQFNLAIALGAHLAFHSLTKTMLFQTAGNLLLAYGTRAIAPIKGLGEAMPLHSALWVAGILAICGMPPSVLFLTELALVGSANAILAAAILLLLFIVFAAMSRTMLAMTMGKETHAPGHESFEKPSRLLAIVPCALLVIILGAGIASSVYCAIGATL